MGRVATGTMGYKHREADLAQVKASLETPNFLFKIIPHVDGIPRICELVEYHLEDVAIKGAWTRPAALHLSPHALAPVAELPVLEIVSAIHILADLTLGLGEVVTTICGNQVDKRCASTKWPWRLERQSPHKVAYDAACADIGITSALRTTRQLWSAET